MSLVFGNLVSMPPPNSDSDLVAHLEFRAQFGDLIVNIFAFEGREDRDISVMCVAGTYHQPDGNPGEVPGSIVADAVSFVSKQLKLAKENPAHQKNVIAKILSSEKIYFFWEHHGGVPPKLQALLNPMIVAEREQKEISDKVGNDSPSSSSRNTSARRM